VELTGQTILGLLNKAAQVADENTKDALDIAHKLLRQLRVAEDRLAALEADLKHYRDRAERAQEALDHISVEIEQRFFASADRIRA
jgi:molecular chaperone GrpE (heat shock protein)